MSDSIDYGPRTWEFCAAVLRMKGFIRDGAAWWRPGDDQTAEIVETVADADDWSISYGN